MKKYLGISFKLSLALLILCSLLFPLLIAAIGKAAPGGGDGETVKVNGKVVGYKNIGQQFSEDKYFQGRPSAVSYNAGGSGGSNKGASNPDYLQQVKDRIDTFLVHNPGVSHADIPADLVTASGSGLDPDISPASALVQVKRIAAIRHLPEEKLKSLVAENTEKHMLGFGPTTVNVLLLNIALDNLK
ncbi:potassium-transporting ATPase subunit KdpC [Flavihumibacter petaseus]|uniref:Potassium-transporting ATPase KdpC subunit n=1 Tax=Flavihumibacter petaseus NBRC 106054 TaxID=1220578 RepID=A0A0E9MV63_9BACT|nr:potassium-transporting ATPase subunit KdpC [Flavihumibacter petaseus]GAO41015.1 potassium-transporting ATPase C chain [Flavihumibacter petaseus NBRC 106054]